MNKKQRTKHCPGCKVVFPCNMSEYDIIHIHMLKNGTCKNYVHECHNCKRHFLSISRLNQHINANSNRECKKMHDEISNQSSYCTTFVDQHLGLKRSNTHSNTDDSDLLYEVTDLELIRSTFCTSKVKCNTIDLTQQNIDPTKDNIINSICSDDSEKSQIGENEDDITNDDEIINLRQLHAQNLCDDMSTDSNGSGIEDIDVDTTPDVDLDEDINDNFDYHPTDHLLKILEIKIEETLEPHRDEDYISSLQLLKTMLSSNIPLSNYDKLMTWKNSSTSNRKKHMTIDKCLKIATFNTYGKSLAQRMSPKVIPMKLQSGRSCYMVSFDSSAMIFDMLNNSSLTNISNMIFKEKNDNPFCVESSSFYADIDTCTVYQQTYDNLKINPCEHILAPLSIYLDELKMDAFGKMGLEPVVLTILIYNRATRNHHSAHRVIGYMPNFHMIFKSKGYSADDKANDYHQCLKVILDDLRKMQRKDGMSWKFKFPSKPNTIYDRKLIFPLFYVVGDAKGNDLLAGRYGSRNNTRCIARDCDVQTKFCDNPKHFCNFHVQKRIKSMNEEKLQLLSFRKLKNNAFSDIWFGSQPYGLYAALPPEPLHVFNLGIVERLMESFLKRLSSNLIESLDVHVAYIATNLSRQSDRSYPCLDPFKNGISEATKLKATEKLARIFVVYIALLTSDFEEVVTSHKVRKTSTDKLDGHISKDEYRNWLTVFEETLMVASWIYSDRHCKIFFQGGRKSVANKRMIRFLSMYKKFAPRTQGMGLKIIKFHHLLHLWWVIRMFGSLLNVDSSRGESNNRILAKQVGKSTQQQHKTLNLQTAVNMYKKNLILTSLEQSINSSSDGTQKCVTSEKKPNTATGSKFQLVFDYDKETLSAHWTSFKLKGRRCNFSETILMSVYHKLKNYNGGIIGRRIKCISGCTEFIIDNEECSIVRACPNYRQLHHWHDWINVSWEDDNDEIELCAQLLIILDTSQIVFEEFESNNTEVEHDVIPHKIVAFVHSTSTQRPSKTMPVEGGNGYTSNLATWIQMENEFHMIDACSISGTCFVLIDKTIRNGEYTLVGSSERVIRLCPKSSWSSKFLDYSNTELIRLSQSNFDNRIVDEDNIPFEY